MVTVTAIYCYPVKSCKPVKLESAVLSQQGLPYDRHWMVVGSEGKFVTQRNNARLALIETELTDAGLKLAAAGSEPIVVPYTMPQGDRVLSDVWGETVEGIDEGSAVSTWLSQVLQSEQPMRLIRMAGDFQRQHSQAVFKEQDDPNKHHVNFADAAPYLLAAEESLAELNKSLIMNGEQPVPMNRFRANIVVKGLPAFKEHSINTLKHPDYGFSFRSVCERCVMTTIDQQTAIRDSNMQPFRMLQTINGSEGEKPAPLFGHNVVLQYGAATSIRVGDQLDLE